jgi:hypothetical protein
VPGEILCATQVTINYCSVKCFSVPLNATGLLITVSPSFSLQNERRIFSPKAN